MNLPIPFISEIKKLLKDGYPLFFEALQENPPISIRMNNKISLTPSDEKVAWCDDAYYLNDRPLFTADPLFHAGAYYVQEASSMFLWQVLEQWVEKDSLVLDLSAAPGGKSTLISQFLSENGFLVSNEIVKSRAFILAENMIKWGNDNVLVSNNSPKDFQKLPSSFDVVVVDAPCSGEGMFRKDTGAIHEWSEGNVQMCAERQRDILTDVWDTLKTGGILIYSTCTYNQAENENNMAWVVQELGAEYLPIDISRFPEITVSDYGYRFYPHKTRGEGFFITALRKTAESPRPAKAVKKKNKSSEKPNKVIESFSKNLLNPSDWEISLENNIVSAVRKIHAETVEQLKNNLQTMHFGIGLAEQKGKDFIPHIALALSKNLNIDIQNRVEVDKETAIRYLQKEAVHFPDAEKAYVLLTYQSLPTGWIKNIGNRSNNLYPAEWRIRMRI